ncbi:growth factor receptor-bound protein 14-like isoform X2 [Tachypleus tridentatus]|uniref:growth factor receptor-bound protein 14-like isoform X2 n=1 Tax=Tachypleus tridentatus TaxID=6853 RepID=UPI003FCEFB62
MNCLHLSPSFLGPPTMCSKAQDEDLPYELLPESETASAYNFLFGVGREAEETERTLDQHSGTVMLTFHLENGSQQQMIVEEGLRVIDLCHLLTLKFNLARSCTWSIVEQLQSVGIERSLEDHEEALQVYSTWDADVVDSNKFIFRQDFHKYEFFRTPQQFYLLDMVDLGSDFKCLSDSTDLAKVVTIQNMIRAGDAVPVVQGYLWIKDPSQHLWKKFFFQVKENILNISLYSEEKVPQHMHPFVDLRSSDIYLPIEGNCIGAPTEFCFSIKPKQGVVKTTNDLKWFCCENRKQQHCWIVSLRLAKYGKKLRENYEELKTRYGDNTVSNSTDTDDGQLLSDYTTMKNRVAMDFTGKSGRVVENPREAKAIAAAGGRDWRRRLPVCRGMQSNFQGSFEFGIHTVQPWFYRGMSREDATQLLTKYGTVDGVFLVRESRRNPGTFVLSYVYNQKIYHTQIVPVEEKTQVCFSLDAGRTKFYDLLQLIEFYQLNLGCLPTKLTHFLVHQPKPRDSPS